MLEHVVVGPEAHVRACQAQRPAPNEGACTHPELWPDPPVATTDSDATRASVLLDPIEICQVEIVKSNSNLAQFHIRPDHRLGTPIDVLTLLEVQKRDDLGLDPT